MAYLKTGDFTKTASAGPYAGKDRHEIVLLKIKDKSKFTISSTETGPKVLGIAYDKISKILTYRDPTSARKTKDIAITKIFKDKDFGGGAAGSGGGADLTKITESGQCYWCSYAFNIKKGKITKPPTNAELTQAAKFVQADESLDGVLSKTPEEWFDVYTKTANILVNKFKSKTSGDVYFHRGSNFMGQVYQAYKQVKKADSLSNNRQAPGSFSNDKWNPGDIWMSTYSPTTYPLVDKFETWSELNQQVLKESGKLGGKTKLLGISLKKVFGNGRLEEYNLPKRVNNIEAKYEGFRFGKIGNFFSSQDIYMYMGGKEVQFRTFSGDSAWQGEIKGSSAAGGKIGGGNVNFYCEKHIGQSIGSTGIKTNWSEFKSDSVNDTKMYDLYKEFYNKQLSFQKADYPLMAKAEFLKTLKSQSSNFRVSKYMCMLFLETFYSGRPNQRNAIVTEMVRYAASNTDQSSYFVKVS